MPCSDGGQREYMRERAGLSPQLPNLPWEVVVTTSKLTIAAFAEEQDALDFARLYNKKEGLA